MIIKHSAKVGYYTICRCWPFNIWTHWGRVTHICVSNLSIIGSENGLSPGRHQAIIWTDAGISLIWPLGTNFSEISIEMQQFSLKKVRLNMSSAVWRQFCLCLNALSTTKSHQISSLIFDNVIWSVKVSSNYIFCRHYPIKQVTILFRRPLPSSWHLTKKQSITIYIYIHDLRM